MRETERGGGSGNLGLIFIIFLQYFGGKFGEILIIYADVFDNSSLDWAMSSTGMRMRWMQERWVFRLRNCRLDDKQLSEGVVCVA